MKNQEWIGWAPAILWMGVIFAFSQHANIETGLSCDFTVKKNAHFFEYGLLAAAFYHALGGSWRRYRAVIAHKAWALATLYAVSDEFHQWFVPTRTATPRDVVIDSLGAAVGLMAWRLFLRHRSE
jgi:VanZ family protein